MSNLTIVVDNDVLKRARMRALENGTSVNAILREHLEHYAAQGDGVRSVGARLRELAAASRSGSGSAGRTWTRDELYER